MNKFCVWEHSAQLYRELRILHRFFHYSLLFGENAEPKGALMSA